MKIDNIKRGSVSASIVTLVNVLTGHRNEAENRVKTLEAQVADLTIDRRRLEKELADIKHRYSRSPLRVLRRRGSILGYEVMQIASIVVDVVSGSTDVIVEG